MSRASVPKSRLGCYSTAAIVCKASACTKESQPCSQLKACCVAYRHPWDSSAVKLTACCVAYRHPWELHQGALGAFEGLGGTHVRYTQWSWDCYCTQVQLTACANCQQLQSMVEEQIFCMKAASLQPKADTLIVPLCYDVYNIWAVLDVT